MDRSYLSNQQVVSASRDFVCVRLITFEDTKEAALMKRLLGGRRMVNTAFTLMDPAGRRALTRVGRSPNHLFDDGKEMAARMLQVAKKYPARKKTKSADLGLPVLEDVRVALNVTECDAQQLVIVRGSGKKVEAMRKALTELCWSDKIIGHFLYAESDADTDWSVIDGAGKALKSGLLIVRSDKYGLTGEVVASVSASKSKSTIEAALLKAIKSHRPKTVDTRRVRREGMRNGVKWRAELPLPKVR